MIDRRDDQLGKVLVRETLVCIIKTATQTGLVFSRGGPIFVFVFEGTGRSPKATSPGRAGTNQDREELQGQDPVQRVDTVHAQRERGPVCWGGPAPIQERSDVQE